MIRNTIKAALFAIAISCWVTPYPSFAETWRFDLHEGKQYRLCQSYLKNLNSFPAPPYMLCERRVSPSFPDFRKPNREELDPAKHFDVLKEIFQEQYDMTAMTMWSNEGGYTLALKTYYPTMPTVEAIRKAGHRPPSLEDLWRRVRQPILDKAWASFALKREKHLIQNGERRLGRAVFDLDHTGGPETVYRLGLITKNCEQKTSDPVAKKARYRWSYHVLRRDNAELNEALRGGLTAWGSIDGFFYRGRFYYDVFSGLAPLDPREELTVVETKLEKFQPIPPVYLKRTVVCTFKYNGYY